MKIRYNKSYEPFSISLKGNPSTGYVWKYKETSGLVLLTTRETVDQPDFIGSSTTVIFTFQTEQAGEFKLKIVKIRPWENGNEIDRYEEIIISSQ